MKNGNITTVVTNTMFHARLCARTRHAAEVGRIQSARRSGMPAADLENVLELLEESAFAAHEAVRLIEAALRAAGLDPGSEDLAVSCPHCGVNDVQVHRGNPWTITATLNADIAAVKAAVPSGMSMRTENPSTSSDVTDGSARLRWVLERDEPAEVES